MLRTFGRPEENARLVPLFPAGELPQMSTLKRDFAPPVPIGAYVVMVARVVGYDPDCDGSAMARLEFVDREGETTGWTQGNIGLYPETELLVDHPHDLWDIASRNLPDDAGQQGATDMRYPADRPGWLGPGQPWPCGRCGREEDDETKHDCQPKDAPEPAKPWCGGFRQSAKCGVDRRHGPHAEGERPAWFEQD